jgi:hypothetical protein
MGDLQAIFLYLAGLVATAMVFELAKAFMWGLVALWVLRRFWRTKDNA